VYRGRSGLQIDTNPNQWVYSIVVVLEAPPFDEEEGGVVVGTKEEFSIEGVSSIFLCKTPALKS
jgi:hypothetical protein